jgi:hypothetical protein
VEHPEHCCCADRSVKGAFSRKLFTIKKWEM